MLSYGIEQGDISDTVLKLHPLGNELRTFERMRNTVLATHPDPRYQEHGGIHRLVA